MNDVLHTHRAHIINLCYDIIDACALTDIEAVKHEARRLLQDMGIEHQHMAQQMALPMTPPIAPHVTEDWSDLL